MKNRILLPLIFCLGLALKANSQELLTLEQAIATGLKNNFSILLSKNNLEISKNNNTSGNAGFLPVVNATGSYVNTTSNTHQEYYDGRVKDATNAGSYSMNTGVAMNWTVFDGMAMFNEHSRLKENELNSESQLKNEVENTVAQITVAYYGIVQQNKLLDVMREALGFSAERKQLMQHKFRLGGASELDYLQAVVDLNADSVSLIQETTNLSKAMAELNYLIGLNPDAHYMVEDTVVSTPLPVYEELIQPVSDLNTGIDIARRNARMAEYNLRITKSIQYPAVNLTAAYNFAKSHTQVGIVETNRNFGPNFGLNFSYTLFDGFNNSRKIKNARIEQLNTEIQLNETIAGVKNQLYKLFTEYSSYRVLIRIEETNVLTARHNTTVAFEKYRLGELNDLDFRQIQLKQLEAENRLLQSRYQLKVFETELLRISGGLIKEDVEI